MLLNSKRVMKDHSSRVNSVAQLGTEGIFVTASSDKTVKVWSVSEKKCFQTFSNYDTEVEDVVTVDEKTLILVCGLTVRVFRITDGYIIAESAPFDFTLCPFTLLRLSTGIVGDARGNLFKLEWKTGTDNIVQQIIKAIKECICHIFVYGNKFLACSRDKTAKLWDATSLELIRTFRGHNNVCMPFHSTTHIWLLRQVTIPLEFTIYKQENSREE